jgi:manganese transport protein
MVARPGNLAPVPDSPPEPTPSLPESFRSVAVPRSGGFWRKMLAFAGPGYLVAVGYMDPGNWATDLAGGSRFGYRLLPVILVSSVTAIFLQWMAMRLGVASGLDLAQACRRQFPRAVNFLLWIACEIAIIACNLAEVIGSAIALKLLFGLPMTIGVVVTALDVFLILALQSRGFRYVEALVITLIGLIGACFVFEMVWSRPDAAAILGAFRPDAGILTEPAALYLALGIFGATVMPHNLYLHSSLAQTRRFARTDAGKREAIRFGAIDSAFALTLALLVNAAILILAAAAFHASGRTDITDIEQAYHLLEPMFGTALASILFGVALLAAGQNSTLTGALAGQIVMEGFLGLKINPLARRLVSRGVAIVPALAVAIMAGDHGVSELLILSQVVLSVQLGFAVIPLVMFTSDRELMGAFVNSRPVAVIGSLVAGLIVLVNGWLVVQAVAG